VLAPSRVHYGAAGANLRQGPERQPVPRAA
jgi:hypothetical protein